MYLTTKIYRYFKALVLIASVLALCVVVLGAYVRLTDAGLGCPDWPGCYGTLTVPQSEAAIASAQAGYPHSTVEVGKAWREMAHRYLAGILGLIVLAIFIFGWRAKAEIKCSPWTPTFLLVLITFQAMLGMWTVTMLLKPAIVSAHLLGGMSTLAILTWLAHRHWGHYSASIVKSGRLKFAIRFALLILFMQIFLGGWTSTNYAALACTDFPTCHGMWVPEMDFKDAFHMVRELGQSANGGGLTLASITAIQWAHRVGALITFIYLGLLVLNIMKYWQLKRLGIILFVVLCAQILLGISNLILHLPLVLAVAHNFTAGLLVIILVTLNSKISSSSR
ncbi:MAG: COX15/CtaA family protein [Methylotenera sp.]|uniref:COX15/CtaA family protein n=2 Tax=Methylotenera sp. TaxID=2051956 RepID=UPI0027288E99|nr:COX15/CtaA family protein [Methylotenera sp.]MDO9393284.1 COX15/CtaA family protein [Methylotenera sp.]